MRIPTASILLITLVAATAGAGAEEKPDAAVRASTIAPFLDEETFAVVHVDVTRIAVEPLLAEIIRLVPEPFGDLPQDVQEARAVLAAIIQAGGKDVYAVVTMNTPMLQGVWPVDAFLVVPLPPGADEAAIRAAFPVPESAKQRLGNLVVVGHSETIQRVLKMQPDPRPELAEAFAAPGDTAAQVLLIPPTYTRRVLEEAVPRLPKALGGGPSKVLARGLLWAAVGIDVPPHAALRLTIQSEDARAAEAFQTKLVDLMRLVGQIEKFGKYLPKFDEGVALLTPKVEGDRLVLTLDEKEQGISKALALLVPPVEILRIHFGRHHSVDNLKRIGLAMHNYHDVNKHFPAPASYSKDKKPLLSWRVHVLPYLEHGKLYAQFHLDEPWDSPHNRTLVDKMPDVYRLPGSRHKEKGLTNYVVPVGNGAAFDATKPVAVKDITDGTSNTIMVIEVAEENAVIWTKPDDWAFDPKNPTQGLGRLYDGGFNTTFCDGSVHFLQPTQEIADTLRKLFTRAGGEPVSSH